MAKLELDIGSTGVALDLFIQNSTATDGAGLTGLLGTSAGLTCFYHRPFGTAVPVTLTTGSVTQAYTSGLFVEINSTAMPGFYTFHPPDTAFAAGAGSVSFMLKGASNMAQLPLEIQLKPGTATVVLATAVAAAPTVAQITTAVWGAFGTGTVMLRTGVHTDAVIPIVQTASNALSVDTVRTSTVTNFVAGALARFFDLDAGTFSTASANSIVRQIATNAGGGSAPTVEQITTAVWAAFGTGTVTLRTGVHTGAIVPITQTASVALVANAVAVATSVLSVDTVRTSTVTNFVAGALARFFDLDAGTFSTASANSIVRQITTNAGGGSAPSVEQITTAVWAAFGTGTVMLRAAVHTGAVVPIVQTASVALVANNVGTATVVLTVDTVRTATTVNAVALTAAERLTLAGVIGTASQAEAYPGTGTAGSGIAAMLYELRAHVGNSNIVTGTGTTATKVLTRLDQTTTAQNYQINLTTASAPVGIQRA